MRSIGWCERCGADLRAGARCGGCWDGRADEALVAALVGSAWLAQVDDPRAARALRRLAAQHEEAGVRSAALRSLGWSGDRSDVPLVAAALAGGTPDERAAAIAALGELGGPAAADALAERLELAAGDELEQVVAALAWLRDGRALPAARSLAAAAVLEPHHHDRRNPVWALVRLGDDADRARLRAHGSGAVAVALASEGFAPAAPAAPAEPSAHADLARRVLPTAVLAELCEEPLRPAAKFGGQPDWLDAPAWPHASDGRPLIFYGQLPLLDGTDRMAYVFVSYLESWEPLGEMNALVVQPGPLPDHIACRPRATGPGRFEPVPHRDRFRPPRTFRPYQRFVRLAVGAEPDEAHGAWNKIGGAPRWLQGPERLPGDGWRYAFQFTAGWAGHDLGDGAECYGFVHADGRGAFAWQCH